MSENVEKLKYEGKNIYVGGRAQGKTERAIQYAITHSLPMVVVPHAKIMTKDLAVKMFGDIGKEIKVYSTDELRHGARCEGMGVYNRQVVIDNADMIIRDLLGVYPEFATFTGKFVSPTISVPYFVLEDVFKFIKTKPNDESLVLMVVRMFTSDEVTVKTHKWLQVHGNKEILIEAGQNGFYVNGNDKTRFYKNE